jgi:hypothetical protein
MYFSIKKYFKNHRYTKHVINNCVAKLKRVTWIEASLSSNKASRNIEFVPQNVRWRPLKWPAYSCHFYSLMRSEEFNNVISWKEFKTWVQCTLSFPDQWYLILPSSDVRLVFLELRNLAKLTAHFLSTGREDA